MPRTCHRAVFLAEKRNNQIPRGAERSKSRDPQHSLYGLKNPVRQSCNESASQRVGEHCEIRGGWSRQTTRRRREDNPRFGSCSPPGRLPQLSALANSRGAVPGSPGKGHLILPRPISQVFNCLTIGEWPMGRLGGAIATMKSLRATRFGRRPGQERRQLRKSSLPHSTVIGPCQTGKLSGDCCWRRR